jgi:hypothetical protein
MSSKTTENGDGGMSSEKPKCKVQIIKLKKLISEIP